MSRYLCAIYAEPVAGQAPRHLETRVVIADGSDTASIQAYDEHNAERGRFPATTLRHLPAFQVITVPIPPVSA